ncbi:MAG: dienelactone hydrolase family protein [Myxococcales bacterium]
MKPDEILTIKGVRGTLPFEVFKPRGAGPWPAVLIIHELIGLNDDIRGIARRFADNGYLAGCPDLMADGGRIKCVRSALESLRKGAGPTVDQLTTGIEMLRARRDTSDVGVAGFCMGGGFATLLATRQKLGAAAVFYGDIRPSEELKNACPIVGGYGGKDKAYRSKGEKLKQRLTQYGIPNDIAIYPDAVHSYMNRGVSPLMAALIRPVLTVAYNEAAAEDSWSRMLGFFGEHLRKEREAISVGEHQTS